MTLALVACTTAEKITIVYLTACRDLRIVNSSQRISGDRDGEYEMNEYEITDSSNGDCETATTMRAARDSARRMLGVSRMYTDDTGDGIYCFGTLKECREFEQGDAVVIRSSDQNDNCDPDY